MVAGGPKESCFRWGIQFLYMNGVFWPINKQKRLFVCQYLQCMAAVQLHNVIHRKVHAKFAMLAIITVLSFDLQL